MTVREREQFRKDCETMTAWEIGEAWEISHHAAYHWARNLGVKPKRPDRTGLVVKEVTLKTVHVYRGFEISCVNNHNNRYWNIKGSCMVGNSLLMCQKFIDTYLKRMNESSFEMG